MRQPFRASIACLGLLLLSMPANRIFAQEPASSPPPQAPVQTVATAPAVDEKIVVPAGTRLPLLLQNGINTRTAKRGDSVYFQSIYPIAVNNRILIPMGSFVRGELLETKRPGFIKGRGEIRMALNQITFPNGYSIVLAATPNSADRDGREGVDKEGKIKGPSGAGRDAGILLATGVGGAYIGSIAGGVANNAPGKGALIGGGIGGALGLIAVLATRGPEAELPRGTTLDVVFDRPLVLDGGLLPANEPGRPPALPQMPLQSRRDVTRQDRPRDSSLLLLRMLVPLMRF